MNTTERTQKVLEKTLSLARQNTNPEITPAHALFVIFDNEEEIAQKSLAALHISSRQIANDLNLAIASLPKVKGGTEPISGNLFGTFLDDAENIRVDLRDEFLSIEHLLLAGVRTKQVSVTQIFKNLKVDYEFLKKTILQIRGNNRVTDTTPETKLDILNKYARDLTEAARDNKLDPVIGRDNEIRRVIQILSRRTKNNPILIGEPGVGKTAIAEGLAQRIISGDVPETLRNRKLMALDIAALVAGAKFRGEFEERLKAVLKAVSEAAGSIILFIDEIHSIVKAGGAEGAVDAGNMLKPALARGDLRCIGATTLDEYRIIEKDPALARRFQPVLVNPPTVDETITILRGLKERYEIHHGVRIKDSAIVAAVNLSDRYISDRFLPDKAIDLIDESASRLKIQLDSVPEILDKTERKIAQYKIELAALIKEPEAFDKVTEIKSQIAQLEAEALEMRKLWRSGKEDARQVSSIKERIEELKRQMQEAERKAEYSKASELKYGELPKLLQRLYELTQKPSAKPNADNSNTKSIILKEEVDTEDIASVVSSWTGIPVNKLFSAEKERLLTIENEMRLRVVGQDHVLKAVANAIRLSRSGIKDPSRPLGSFLFLGPTGVGKTETAKTLAVTLFSSEKAMLRFDMSEFMEEHSVAKLIGSPPGYVGFEDGGQLTEAVRRKPYSIILFDEIEKAHPRVLNILLQLLDDGRLTDSHGRTVFFNNTVIILTSNIGSQEILHATSHAQPVSAIKEIIMRELLKHLRPELINRIDETLIFNPLGIDVIDKIVGIQIAQLNTRLSTQNIKIQLTPQATQFVANAGWDVAFGARPLRRAIQEYIEVPLSILLLSGETKENCTFNIDVNNDKLTFTNLTDS